VLTINVFNFIIAVVSDASEDILQITKAKQETMYERIEAELRGVHKSLHSSHVVSTTPPPLEGIELGYEPAQLHIIVDATEAHLCRRHEEKE
jgi:hypothetical protein